MCVNVCMACACVCQLAWAGCRGITYICTYLYIPWRFSSLFELISAACRKMCLSWVCSNYHYWRHLIDKEKNISWHGCKQTRPHIHTRWRKHTSTLARRTHHTPNTRTRTLIQTHAHTHTQAHTCTHTRAHIPLACDGNGSVYFSIFTMPSVRRRFGVPIINH